MDLSTRILNAQLALGLILGSVATAWSKETISAAERAFFEKKIRPVLVKECFECHSAGSKNPITNLKLDAPLADASEVAFLPPVSGG